MARIYDNETANKIGILWTRVEDAVVELDGCMKTEPAKELMEEWRRGAGIIHYSGHGGRKQWSSAGILLETDLSNLGNGNRPATAEVKLTADLQSALLTVQPVGQCKISLHSVIDKHIVTQRRAI